MNESNSESPQINNLLTAEELRGDLESFTEKDIFRDQLLNIIEAKKELVKQTRINIFSIILATNLYKQGTYNADYLKNISSETDFRTLLDVVRKNFKEKFGGTLRFKDDKCNESIVNIVNDILSIDYSPPSNFVDLYNHLGAIEICYDALIEIPLTINYLMLDLSFLKLMRDACVRFTCGYKYGESVLKRLKKSAQKLSSITNDKKTFVYEIYYRCQKVKMGMSLNAISKVIEHELSELQKKGDIPFELRGKKFQAPGVHQIKRYLMENENIEKDFIKEGRYWILQR